MLSEKIKNNDKKVTITNNKTKKNYDHEKIIVGIDCEAIGEMSRFGKISLIQVCIENISYVFDMLTLSHLPEFNEITKNDNIIKIFHDATEDCAILINNGVISEMKCVYDTQIAYRYLFENKTKMEIKTSKSSNISLKNLLYKYFKINKDENFFIKGSMKENSRFWEKRPLTKEMIEYASKDVFYLEKLFKIMNSSINLKQKHIDKIFEDSLMCYPYSCLNLKIEEENRLNLYKKDDNMKVHIDGLIR